MKFSVTQNGQELSKSLYTWDSENFVFSTKESNLILDFSNINHATFKTSDHCTFKTGSDCIFDTGSYCTFKTSFDCSFDTGSHCIFDTSFDCIFDTGINSVLVRRDIFEVHTLPENTAVKIESGKPGLIQKNTK